MAAEDKVTILFHVTVKEGREQEFREEAKRIAEKVRSEEEGCVAYNWYQQKRAPREFVVLEQYRDRKALGAHIAHLQAMYGPPASESDPLPAKFLEYFDQTRSVFYEELGD